MSTLAQIVGGDISDEAVTILPEVLDAALAKGQSLLASVSDPAVKAGLQAMLNTLATPAAKTVLTQVAVHEVHAATVWAGLKLDGPGRAAFMADPGTSFEQRHAMLDADDQATRQAADDRAALVSSLESLAADVVVKGGIAALPFLLAIL
jgi:hypothetical protein